MRPPPVFHMHVRVVDQAVHAGEVFVCLEEPNGRKTWMPPPGPLDMGQEMTLYVIQNGSAEMAEMGRLVAGGATPEELQEFTHRIARQYGEWCEKTWDQAWAEGQVKQ